MNYQYNERDYGYTVISRFEEVLREEIVEFIELKENKFEEYIPKGVVDAAKSREDEFEAITDL